MNGYVVIYREKWYIEFDRFALRLATTICLFFLFLFTAFQIWKHTPVTGQYDSLISVHGTAYPGEIMLLQEQLSLLPEWVIEAYQKEGNLVYLSSVPLENLIDAEKRENTERKVLGLHERESGISCIWVLNTERAIEKATLHEFGHFIDHYFWKQSDREKFQKCYEQEKENFLEIDGNEHNISTPTEYFAESVLWYIKDPEKLEDNCSETYNYMHIIFLWGRMRT